MTLAGPVGLAILFWPLLAGNQPLAGWVVLFGGAFDSLDGAVARISGGVTRFGAYLDSVVDRFADLLVMFGLLAWLLHHHPSGTERTVYLVAWGVATLAQSRPPTRAPAPSS